MTNTVSELLHDENGATAIEYGLIAALIAIAAIGAFQSFAGSSVFMWMTVSSATLNATSGNAGA